MDFGFAADNAICKKSMILNKVGTLMSTRYVFQSGYNTSQFGTFRHAQGFNAALLFLTRQNNFAGIANGGNPR